MNYTVFYTIYSYFISITVLPMLFSDIFQRYLCYFYHLSQINLLTFYTYNGANTGNYITVIRQMIHITGAMPGLLHTLGPANTWVNSHSHFNAMSNRCTGVRACGQSAVRCPSWTISTATFWKNLSSVYCRRKLLREQQGQVWAQSLSRHVRCASRQDKEWHDFRSAVNQVMMQPRNVQQCLEPINNVSQEFIERWGQAVYSTYKGLTFWPIASVGVRTSHHFLEWHNVSPQ